MPVTIFRGKTASELHASSSRVAPVEDDGDAGAVAVRLRNDAAVERRLRALEEREAAVLRREAARRPWASCDSMTSRARVCVALRAGASDVAAPAYLRAIQRVQLQCALAAVQIDLDECAQ